MLQRRQENEKRRRSEKKKMKRIKKQRKRRKRSNISMTEDKGKTKEKMAMEKGHKIKDGRSRDNRKQDKCIVHPER